MRSTTLLLTGLFLLTFTIVYGCTDTALENADGDTDISEHEIADSDMPSADGDDDMVVDGDVGDVDDATIPLTYPVVDTNQKACYGTDTVIACPAEDSAFSGQDIQYSGNEPRYQNNEDGTVTDLVTGLMWQKDPGAKMTYDAAVAGAGDFTLAGYDDWRLPTIKELYSLIQFSGVDPSGYEGTDTSGMIPFIDTEYFDFAYGDTSTGSRIIDSQWVTSSVYESTVMGGMQCFFGVNFADGRIKCYPTTVMPGQNGYFVIHVRNTGSYGTNNLTDNGDGTITDAATGLMWEKDDNGTGVIWQDALSTCEGLDKAGYDDWRLPNAKELQSIVDYSRSPDTTSSPAIDPVFTCTQITNEAGQPDYAFYWSSTTHVNWTTGHDGGNAAYVSFGRALGYWQNQWQDVHGAGAQRSDPKVGNPADYPTGHGPQGDAIRIYNMVRCVRDGDVTADFDPQVDGDIDGDIDGDVDEDIPPVDGDVMPDEEPAQGPVACTQESDCQAEGACPPDATLGCQCRTMPEGGSFCVPSCNTNADCPQPPDVTLVCDTQGICVPQNR